MINLCECGSEYIVHTFARHKILECTSCKSYKSIELECDHVDWNFVKFKIANGTFQLRKYCKNCYFSDGKSLKQDPNVKYRESELQKFHEFVAKLDEPFNVKLHELRLKYNETFRDRYELYINSPEWSKKRASILNRDEYTCKICGKAATDVHHLTYTNLSNEFDFELISLCQKCHYEIYHPEKIN